jgi:tetratricopeptide (TPR) repeat protein
MTSIPSESHEELEKLERKHAEHPEGRYFVPLANLYRRHGELDRAMTLLRDGLAKHPDYLSAHIVLGRCLADRGENEAAEAEFLYVLSLDSQNLIALRTMGELAATLGKVDEGRRWYRELLGVDPMNEDARLALETIGTGASTTTPGVEAEGGELPVARPGPPVSPLDSEDKSSEDLSAVGSPSPEDYQVLFGSTVQLDLPGGLDDQPGDFLDGSDAVVTETIAELYTRQGFYERAAEVYRELIRRRGGDDALEERLRHVESMTPGASGPEPPPGAGETAPYGTYPPMSSPELGISGLEDSETIRFEFGALSQEPPGSPAAPPDAFADSFAEGFPSGEETAPAAAAAAPRTIRSFLGDLLTWRPSAGDAETEVGIPDAPSPSTGEQSAAEEAAEPIPEAEPSEEGAVPDMDSAWMIAEEEPRTPVAEPTDAPWWMSPEAATEQPLPDPTTADAENILEVLEADLERAVAGGDEADAASAFPSAVEDELFPWELPGAPAEPPPPVGTEVAHDAGAPAGFVEDLPGVPEEPPPPAEPDTVATSAEPSLGATFPDEPAATPPPATQSNATAEEDDDLESFQAWLRSLKR